MVVAPLPFMTIRVPIFMLLAALAATACKGGDEGTVSTGTGGGTVCATATMNGACGTDGQVCSSCTNPCQFCNLLRCTNGHWERQEAAPAPCFACGASLSCQTRVEYCQKTTGGAVGAAPHYSCLAYPSRCQGTPTCACLGAALCSDDNAGAVTVTIQAP